MLLGCYKDDFEIVPGSVSSQNCKHSWAEESKADKLGVSYMALWCTRSWCILTVVAQKGSKDQTGYEC